MEIGKHKIGRYPGIIKKIYEDGSYNYETYFTSRNDFYESVFAIQNCIGKKLGGFEDSPKTLKNMELFCGTNNIINELNKEKELEDENTEDDEMEM